MKSRKPIPLLKLRKRKHSQPGQSKKDQNLNINQNEDTDQEQAVPIHLHRELKKNIEYIKQMVGNSSDIVIREFDLGQTGEIKIAIFYTDGLADKSFVNDFILESLMVNIRTANLGSDVLSKKNIYEIIKSHSLPAGEINELVDFNKVFYHILSGDTVVLMDGFLKGLSIGSRGWADRGVQEPSSQTVVRGPKDGFSETLRTNTALIRRRIKDPNLRIETKQIGKKTQTDVSIIYLKDVADEKLVQEVKARLKKINIDAILESGYIEELIQDETYSPFPTVYNTERPDSVAGGILEGRIAIVVDGTPFVLLVPALFVHFFQSSEDYYQRADIATLIRFLRYFAFFLALITPSAYIAVTTFHQEMIPTPLLISLSSQREGVPFPALVEALMMEVTFEILREAGVRMPRAIGSSISIVGALVIGQAAVEAGIISASMVIIVSLTAISSFVSPTFNMGISVRILRFIFMFLAATFGLFGIILGLIMMVLHLNSLRSFGIPYLAPNAPFILKDQKDNFLRLPHWSLHSRPALINQQETVKENTASPKPPQPDEANQ
ncbi:spore germination protein [Bacillus dakarensis]|uniref:spore germination protein n=1 Tax=Robertmurraya dakarensis TaxID=1926278 RepID=UPI00098211D2|nr:spore germination protein [Bacillus dakarensis]